MTLALRKRCVTHARVKSYIYMSVTVKKVGQCHKARLKRMRGQLLYIIQGLTLSTITTAENSL